ncbi:hypothetical protein D3C81_2046040 [compost metagenome]
MFVEKFIGALMLVFGIAILGSIGVGIIFGIGFFWVMVHQNLPVWGQYIFNTAMGGVVLALIITIVSDDEPY